MTTAEFSKFAGILKAALSQHHLLGFEIAQQIDGETVETVADFILGGRSEERRVGKEWEQRLTIFWGAPKSL